MIRQLPWRHLLLAALFWIAAGIFILCGVHVVHCLVTGLPFSPASLLTTAFFGMLAGSLFAAGDVRLRLLTDRIQSTEETERLAYSDALTGLPNRVLLADRLQQAIAHSHRDGRQVGIFFFDLDHFKSINDTYGHATGDLILRAVAQRLKKFIREGDTFARLGGDEFVIVQADPNHEPNFAILAQRILKTLREPIRIDNRELRLTTSVGIAVYPGDGHDPSALLKSADTAMYVAKSRGRNTFQFFSSEMNAAVALQAVLEQRIRRALLEHELTMHYQPQFDLARGRIVSIKALLRCHHQTEGEIPPDEVARVAEASGQIHTLTRWTLETAAAQAMAWQTAGLPEVRIAVTLSTNCLRQEGFVDELDEILQRTGLPAGLLDLELPETTMMPHLQEILPTLTDLKVRGVNLVIAGFGTGHSSITYLRHLPIKRLKIAPEFILNLPGSRDHAAITEAIIAMAGKLGLKVTAVGVETAAQLDFLRKQGCSEIAGMLLSPPLPAAEIPPLFDSLPKQMSVASN